ncbi:MAG: NADH:ubiquinone reductase (Na(+)-transporting) subunit B [Calditerrivibrio sp.]|nr:NADH:ubiquinone reductase (Na(+)-transporting) subunit B [Calditerrivibrio sp.]MCA1932379.1 NADH:ubiquinone reductase (Na(+)-transporting) subunit B [Calditerrivibrio sp.]
MKRFLDKIAPHFHKGGKYERFFPIFEMVDTFIYDPLLKTTGKTHIRDGLDLKRTMIIVFFAILPAAIFGIYNVGYQANSIIVNSKIAVGGFRGFFIDLIGSGYDPNSILSNFIHGLSYFLPLYIVTLVVGGFWEVLFAVVRKHEVAEAFLVTSLLYPLILPPTVPLWQAAVALSIGLVFGKEVFGGTGKNFINPALFSRAILFFSYPQAITGNNVWVAVDGYSKATPLSAFSEKGFDFGYTFMDGLWGFIPGSIGETSAVLCLVGALILVITGVGSWRVMVGMFLGMGITTYIFNIIGSDTNNMFNIPFYYHFVFGGFMFGLAFMITDPVSSSMTNGGKLVYGGVVGFMNALVRVVNPAFPEGTMLAILFGNIFAPFIDSFFINYYIKKREKRYERV